MQPIIILLAGGIGAGKDTMADVIAEQFDFTKLAFADPLKEAASGLFDFPTQWCYTRQGKEKKPTLGANLTVGEILQKFGTEVGRQINPDMWAQLAAKRIRANELDRVAITDCRFGNEALYYLQNYDNAHVIFLSRQAGKLQGSRDANHASENMSWADEFHRANIPNFHCIDNQNMSLEKTIDSVLALTGNIIYPGDAR